MTNQLNKTLGEVTKELRKARKMSQKELARRSELHINTINLLELGASEAKLSTLFFLAKALNVSLEEMMKLLSSKFYN